MLAEAFAAGSDELSGSVAAFFSVPSTSGSFLAREVVPLPPAASADNWNSWESLPCLRASDRSFAAARFILSADDDDEEDALGGGIPDLLRALVGVDAAPTEAAAAPADGVAAAPAGGVAAGLF